MEFLVISDKKLKVILTKEDAEGLDFTAMDADYNTPEGRRSFRKILDIAEEQVGFKSRGEKTLIQFYPSKDGGCEIFVTKLASPAAIEKLGRGYENITLLESKRVMYAFPDIDALEVFKKSAADVLNKYCVYEADNGLYFLDIEENSKKDSERYFYIDEFAKKCSDEFRVFVMEHCNKQ